MQFKKLLQNSLGCVSVSTYNFPIAAAQVTSKLAECCGHRKLPTMGRLRLTSRGVAAYSCACHVSITVLTWATANFFSINGCQLCSRFLPEITQHGSSKQSLVSPENVTGRSCWEVLYPQLQGCNFQKWCGAGSLSMKLESTLFLQTCTANTVRSGAAESDHLECTAKYSTQSEPHCWYGVCCTGHCNVSDVMY